MLLFKYLDLKLSVKCIRKGLGIGVVLESKRRKRVMLILKISKKIKINRFKGIIPHQGSDIVDLFQQLPLKHLIIINEKSVLQWCQLTPHHYQVQVFLEKQRISISPSKVNKIESFLYPNPKKEIFIIISTIILKRSIATANNIKKTNNKQYRRQRR